MLVRLGFQTVLCLTLALPTTLWGADIKISDRGMAAAVARQTTGETFFVWDDINISGRRLDASGQSLDVFDIEITDTSTTTDALPDVAMNDNGQIVVVWEGRDDNGGDLDILARLYSFDTLNPSEIFRINLEEEGNQTNAHVVMDATGQFVVAYQSSGVDGDADGIVLRRFDATGQPLDNGQVVNPSTTGNQRSPALSRGDGGELAVSWIDDVPGSNASLFLRLFDANGTPTSGAISVAEGAVSNALAISNQGNILAVWQGVRTSSRLFDAMGTPLTAAFDVDDPGQNNEDPAVAALESGDFQIVWSWILPQNPDQDILGRIVQHDGTLQGPTFPVTVTRAGPQRQPDIAAEGFGVAVAFTSPAFGPGVFTTCLTPIGCTEVFTDGFETGNTSEWDRDEP